jgi:hypothetical protein
MIGITEEEEKNMIDKLRSSLDDYPIIKEKILHLL